MVFLQGSQEKREPLYHQHASLILHHPIYKVKTETIPIKSLLVVDGLRFILTSFVYNFAGVSVVVEHFRRARCIQHRGEWPEQQLGSAGRRRRQVFE